MNVPTEPRLNPFTLIPIQQAFLLVSVFKPHGLSVSSSPFI